MIAQTHWHATLLKCTMLCTEHNFKKCVSQLKSPYNGSNSKLKKLRILGGIPAAYSTPRDSGCPCRSLSRSSLATACAEARERTLDREWRLVVQPEIWHSDCCIPACRIGSTPYQCFVLVLVDSTRLVNTTCMVKPLAAFTAAHAEGSRPDGRGLRDFREPIVLCDLIGTCEGSASARVGSTFVLAGVRAVLEVPARTHTDVGDLQVKVSCP